MYRFVVAYINFFDNELKQCEVLASSKEHAILLAMEALEQDFVREHLENKTYGQLKEDFMNWDAVINVLEI